MKNLKALTVLASLLLLLSFLTASLATADSLEVDRTPWSNTSLAIPLKVAGGPDGFGYTFQDELETPDGPTYTFTDISATGTPLALTDDGHIDLTTTTELSGFSFEYYGLNVNTLRVGNNGAIIVNPLPTDKGVGPDNFCTPAKYMIAPWWDDWDDTTGTVYWQLNGTGIEQSLIIQWEQMVHYPEDLYSNPVTFQVVLYETSNVIEFHYADATSDLAPLPELESVDGGLGGTIGIFAPTTGLQYGCDSDVLIDGRAIRFQDSSLKVIKQTNPEGGTGFDFTTTTGGLFPTTFSLDDDGEQLLETVPGSYTVTEDPPPAGWFLNNLSCTSSLAAQGYSQASTISITDPTADIDLAPGDEVVCTFENVQYGTIEITKDVDPGTDTNLFGFSGDLGSFSLADDGSNDTHTASSLEPGTYTITEDDPGSDWTLDDISCTVTGTGGSSAAVDKPNRQVTITLNPGDTVQCTFVNKPAGTITIVKDALPDDPESFSFTSSDPGSIPGFDLSDDGTGPNNSQSYQVVANTSYTITETLETNWDLIDIDCLSADGTSSYVADVGNRQVRIDLSAGDTVTCTFTNRKYGTINIIKEAHPSGPEPNFDFSSDELGSFQLAAGQSQTYSVKSGLSYTVTETLPTVDWQLDDITCSSRDETSSYARDVGNRQVRIDLSAGDTVTCTFINKKNGTIEIVKDARPDDPIKTFGFEGDLGSFPLTDDGTGSGNSYSDSLPPDQTYTITETVTGGDWQLDSISCLTDLDSVYTTDPSKGQVDITLKPGDNVQCTFVNKKDATIEITKDVQGIVSTESFTFTGSLGSFSLTDSGTDSFKVTPDQPYTITEDDPGTAWKLDSIDCITGDVSSIYTVDLDNRQVDIEPAPGDTVACTFVNKPAGTIRIIKGAQPADGQSFDFGSDFGSFTLTDGNSTTVRLEALQPYTVTESLPAGGEWDLYDISCAETGGGGSTSTPDTNNHQVRIDLEQGDTVECTFVNKKNGTIEIVKDAQPDTADPFSFTSSDPTNIPDFGLVDDGSVPDDGRRESFSLNPGTYTITETLPAGDWRLQEITCSVSGIDKTSVATPDESSHQVQIELEPGDTVQCTFVNQKPGAITVTKYATPDDGTSFSFSLTREPDFSQNFNLTHSQSQDVLELSPGTYKILEGTIPNWTLSQITCDDPTGGTDDSQNPAVVDLAAGDHVTCIFTNTQMASLGSITIRKEANQAGQSFDFTSSDFGGFSLADGEAHIETSLSPGTYSVTEAELSDWNLTDLVCTGDADDGTVYNLAGRQVSIDLDAGEAIICTFTNTSSAISGGGIYLPLILKGPGDSPSPSTDLTISGVSVSNPSPATGEDVVITATLQHTGDTLSTAFWVDLYLATDPNFKPAVNKTWEDNNGNGNDDDDDSIVPYGVAWKVTDAMFTGGELTVTNLNPNDLTAINCNNFSNFIPAKPGCWETWKGQPLDNAFSTPGTYYLWVLVDSYDDAGSSSGEVAETDETNNLYGPIGIGVGGTALSTGHVSSANGASAPTLEEGFEGRLPVRR